MIEREVDEVLVAIMGYWPRPEMTEETARAWRVELRPMEREDGLSLVSGYIGRQHRPSPSEFHAERLQLLERQRTRDSYRRGLPSTPTDRAMGKRHVAELKAGLAKIGKDVP